MTSKLSRFRIESLHNLRTIDVVISDNKLVLVGENGTDKSTVANLIAFFLTRQWSKMRDYEFKRIVAHLGDKEIAVSHDLIMKTDPKEFRELLHRVPAKLTREFESVVGEISLDEIQSNPGRLRSIADATGIALPVLADYFAHNLADYFAHNLTDYLARGLAHDSEEQLQHRELRKTGNLISTAVKCQVLYLPTYRRIEQDLQAIFPQLRLEEFRMQVRKRSALRANRSSFIELVEFGMEDVEFTIQRRLDEIKENVRTSLSNLTGTYLRDVIKGDYRTADLRSKLQDMDNQTIEPILARIPQAILTEKERVRLREIIQKTTTSGNIAEEDKVVAHFLSQLIDLYETQLSQEADVREFVKVCNRYLSGKEMVYDNSSFSLGIRQRTFERDYSQIQLKMLSSGEKQIVSLFSHIYLSGQDEFFVVIDEPELSLSVPWQKRFLPDILATQKCSGLIAVTHSPFIFENELDEFTHSLEEFVEPIDVVS